MLSKAKFIINLNHHAFTRSFTNKTKSEIKMISKALIGNKEDIAYRVLKKCKKLGIRTVAALSDVDAKPQGHKVLSENAIKDMGVKNSLKYAMLMKGAEKIESETPSKLKLLYLALYAILLQWIAFFHAGGIFGNERTEKYFDLMGSITFLSTLLLSIYSSPRALLARQIILSSFVAIWTLRLGSFLFYRIHNNDGIDSRFTEIKKDNYKFLMVWTLQGVWVFLTLLPVLILNQTVKRYKMTVLDAYGFLLWTLGFTVEAVADYQKYNFRSIPENKGNFMSSGVWAYSRHPNYFGEILLWLGIALSSYSGTKALSVFISPIFVASLLIFVSGIPALEKKADQLYADNEEYQMYKKNTPVLIPFIGRKGNADF